MATSLLPLPGLGDCVCVPGKRNQDFRKSKNLYLTTTTKKSLGPPGMVVSWSHKRALERDSGYMRVILTLNLSGSGALGK